MARRSARRCGCGSWIALGGRRRPRATPARRPLASTSPATWPRISSGSCPRGRRSRAIRCAESAPGHVAVLVRRHRDAALVREALERVGVPAVINGAGSVFATPEAKRVAAAAGGDRASGVDAARARGDDDLIPRLDGRGRRRRRPTSRGRTSTGACTSGRAVLRRRGLASLTETITLIERLPGRVLSVADGERRLTDLRHVGQLLHAAAATERLGTAALTSWLRQRIAAAEQEGDEERSRRLESDAEAVQVLTIHRSKGLEFPIVYLPFLWESTWVDNKPVPVDLPRPGARPRADDRRRPRGLGLPSPPEAAPRGAARRGPPPRLRGADACPAPGDRLVGRLLGWSRLGA